MKEDPISGIYNFSPAKIIKGLSFGISHKYYLKIMISKLKD
jgi:hypothetical protein